MNAASHALPVEPAAPGRYQGWRSSSGNAISGLSKCSPHAVDAVAHCLLCRALPRCSTLLSSLWTYWHPPSLPHSPTLETQRCPRGHNPSRPSRTTRCETDGCAMWPSLVSIFLLLLPPPALPPRRRAARCRAATALRRVASPAIPSLLPLGGCRRCGRGLQALHCAPPVPELICGTLAGRPAAAPEALVFRQKHSPATVPLLPHPPPNHAHRWWLSMAC